MKVRTSTAERVIRNSSVFFAGSVLQRLFSFISAIIMMRALGDEMYGLFAYGLVIAAFAVMIIDFGLENILIREYAKDPLRGSRLLTHALFLKIGTTSSTGLYTPVEVSFA